MDESIENKQCPGLRPFAAIFAGASTLYRLQATHGIATTAVSQLIFEDTSA
jgi:hypothetical protein